MKDVKQKLSRFFPSSFTSCQFLRLLSDVAERSPVPNKTPQSCYKGSQSSRRDHHRARRTLPGCGDRRVSRSYSLDSGWFTSPDAGSEPFRSLSSVSCDSLASRRTPEEITTVSFDAVISRCRDRKPTIVAHKIPTGETKKQPAPNSTPITAAGGDGLGWDRSSTRAYYSKSRRASRARHRRRNTRRVADYSGVVGGSYAVVKRSDDPRGDFRESMVEMISTKKMFAAEDLKRLLLCFLHLNHVSYHAIIYDVFAEVCGTFMVN